MINRLMVCVLLFCTVVVHGAGLRVGVAKVDVTPDFPVRLSGYAARKTPATGVEGKLFVRALAIAGEEGGPCILVTLDSTAITSAITDQVAARLLEKIKLPRERFTLSCTHTHAAPCLSGAIPNMFGAKLAEAEQAAIDRYTHLVIDKIEEAAIAAHKDLRPSTLQIGSGKVGFAANRRTKGGPVDHAMPMLVARDDKGAVRAMLINYACHCTTLGSDINKTHGDWAGHACAKLEGENAGAVAMVVIGCGADSNPNPRGTLALAGQHGDALAAEATRVMRAGEMLKPVDAPPVGQVKPIDLAFDALPTRAQLQDMAKKQDAAGYNAGIHLAKLEKGGVATSLPYTMQTWTFGEQLCIVFLAGEVVVDYSLRIKHDFDPARVMVCAYSNDVPCYIPSRRILTEGGYEAAGAMVYYGQPTRLAPAVENDIVRALHMMIPKSYRTRQSLDEFPLEKTPAESKQCFAAPAGMRVELVAAEPLVRSPVAIDWDIAGRMWVVEMVDYPSGLHDNWTAGGRISVLTDSDGDGAYDKSKVFLDGLPFPQGVKCWRKGVLICAAPDVLYAEDTDGDGRADLVKKLFSGFSPDNQQWEVNNLAWGLDHWVYGASSIHNEPIRIGDTGKTVRLGARDFRMNPDTLAFEPAAGRTQYGRVCDDFGNWFGNDNSTALWHYPLEERYIARNPHVSHPAARVALMKDADMGRVFPISRTLPRFNQPQSANQITSACGPAVYRDLLLRGIARDDVMTTTWALFCEPVHNLVRLMQLTPKGVTFEGHRLLEGGREFLSSTDNWFRPVQARTGPDGAIWVVDMHRFVVEHPRWITPDRLANLDTRAGAGSGRIWRVVPEKGAAKTKDLSGESSQRLAQMLDQANGTLRDLIHQELYWRQDMSAVAALEKVARTGRHPAGRITALGALDGLKKAPVELLIDKLKDGNPNVRRQAVRLGESQFRDHAGWRNALLALADDTDVGVRFQVALALGEFADERIAETLVKITAASINDEWIRAAVLSSSLGDPLAVLRRAQQDLPPGAARNALMNQLHKLNAEVGDAGAISSAIVMLREVSDQQEQFTMLAQVMEIGMRRRQTIRPYTEAADQVIFAITPAAEGVMNDPGAADGSRIAAIRLVSVREKKVEPFARLLSAVTPAPVQIAALQALAGIDEDASAAAVFRAWKGLTPALRQTAMNIIVSRPAWVEGLLREIDERRIAATDVPGAVRDVILRNSKPAIREHAARTLVNARPARQEALKKFAGVIDLKGNADHGVEQFNKSCAACHQLHGVGFAVGPNLAALTDRSAQYLLSAIIDPNAAVEGKFVAYDIETNDDRSITGLLGEESATGLVILQASGSREILRRSEIRSMTSTKLSLMPEGMEEGLTAQGMADLIAFIQRAGGK